MGSHDERRPVVRLRNALKRAASEALASGVEVETVTTELSDLATQLAPSSTRPQTTPARTRPSPGRELYRVRPREAPTVNETTNQTPSTTLAISMSEGFLARAEAALTDLNHAAKAPALFKPEFLEQRRADHTVAMAWSRYWWLQAVPA